MNFLWI